MIKSLREKIRDRIKEHGEAYKINELCLDQIPITRFSSQISKSIEKCSNLEYLTLQNCDLQDLSELPTLFKLTALQLDNNKLSGKDLGQLPKKFPSLKAISLSNNSIESYEYLGFLEPCRYLQRITVVQNPLINESELGEGRKKIFEMLPSIIYVNGSDRFGNKLEQKSENEAFSESEADFSEGEQDSDEQMDSPSKYRKK